MPHHTRIDSVKWSALSQKLQGSTTNTTSGSINSGDASTSEKKDDRMVVVRYFLDRPGYGLHNGSSRLWFHPPAQCQPHHVRAFLQERAIAPSSDGLLVEVYLDKYESFMLLEACEASCVEWNFETVTYHDPGILNIRLTDLNDNDTNGGQVADKTKSPVIAVAPPTYANPTAAGLFSFSVMVGLETVALFGKLVPGSVDPSFAIYHGPYMIFVGGVMQLCVACFNVLRNNLYGAIAFFGFGCFWFSNGLASILMTHFSPPDSLAGEWIESGNSDPWGAFFRSLFVFAFSCALEKQTYVMTKLSSTLIGLLCIKIFFQAFTGWSRAMMWCQLVFGSSTSAFAFYVFLTEFTNGIYHREVFPPFKWDVQHSPEEVFGAAGRPGTLQSKAARLRQANYPNVPTVRGAMDDTAERISSQRHTKSSSVKEA